MGSPAPPPSSPSGLIAGQYAVASDRPIPGAGGRVPAFAASDRGSGRSNLMALQVQPNRPPRARALSVLGGVSPEGVLAPLAHGSVSITPEESGYFVVCPAPPGPALSEGLRPWPESALLDKVLRPAALALQALEKRGVTHRSIRLDNMFRGGTAGQVILGAAWAAPPASLQPALYEPPYSAMCLPCGARGEGSIADDVYALGVALIALALGRTPLAGLEERAVLQQKLGLGSYEALAAGERLPPVIGDLVRGMLAEDPEHRPTPSLLADPGTARGRRVAARPPRRAQRPLELGGIEAWDARVLAFAIAQRPGKALAAIRSGAVDFWLGRSLGDPTLAAKLDEAVREQAAAPKSARAEAILASEAVAVLDPLAPLCWQGVAWWPDGLGPALAPAQAADSEVAGKLEESLSAEAAAAWAGVRPERCDEALLRVEARQHRAILREGGKDLGLKRLVYALNPLLPCGGPVVQKRSVARIADLLPALEAVSATVDRKAVPPVDLHIAAFLMARCELRLDGLLDGSGLAGRAGALVRLRVLARLQMRVRPGPLPGLAAWLASQAEPVLAGLRNRTRRAVLQEALETLAVAGQLQDMLALIDDADSHAADAREAEEAARALARIDAELSDIAAGVQTRAELARCFGQELAAGAGLAALVTVLLAAAFA